MVIFGEKKAHGGTRVRVPVDGVVVGYAMIAPTAISPRNVTPTPFVFAYIVRLDEGCDTKHGIYMREIPVFPEDLTSRHDNGRH